MNKKIPYQVKKNNWAGQTLFVLLLSLIFLVSFVSAIPQTFNVHGRLSNSTGVLTGTYEMNFSLYDVYSGGSYLWNDNYSVTTNSDGVYNIILTNIDLPFSAQYYLGVAVESDPEMTPRVNLTSSGYTFRANVSDYLVSTNNYEMANLTLSQKITFAFGEIIDNIVDGWVRVTGGLDVEGDFKVNGTDFYVNSTSGNVGIGTDNPDMKLKVIGDVNVTGTLYADTISGEAGLNVNNSDYLDGYDSTFFMPLNTSVSGDFDFNGGWTNGGFSISGGDIYAQTGWFYNISSLEVNHLNINGSLFPDLDDAFDIGNASLRWRNLSLSGEVSSDGTGDSYFIGNVGIGTTAPAYKLDVNGSINVANTSAYLYGGVQALKLAKGADTYYANTFVGSGAGVSSAMRQTAVGYQAGQSNTAAYQTALGYYAGNGNTGASQTALGYAAGQSNIGISQTVMGYLAGYLNTGASQTALGFNTGRSNTGTSQTVVGYQAGQYNSGNNVIGLGYQATYNNSGNDVVAIGYDAGKDNTVANQFIVKQSSVNSIPLIQGNFSSGNVGIGTTSPTEKLEVNGLILADNFNAIGGDTSVGYLAGRSSTGISQTVLGNDAGTLNAGDYQTALGYNTGYANAGNYQIAIGYNAGRSNTGVSQTIIGYNAGLQNTGDYQTSLGYYAGYLNTGVYQTAIGTYAGSSNPGVSQTAIGYWAGSSNTGDYQTSLGYYAGYLNSGNYTTGIGIDATRNNSANNVVAIGYEAGEDNTIADQFIVKQNNVNSVPLIQGNFSSGNVGIGTATPSYPLDVAGEIRSISNIRANDKVITSRYGTAGTYNSLEVQGIWSIGDAYQVDTVADDFGNLYGIGYSYSQNGGAPFVNEHQIVFTSNGVVGAAIGLLGSAYFQGNVGIGTASPSSKLEVNGQVSITGASRIKAERITAQIIPTGTYTTVIFDSEIFDNLGEYDTTTGRFTATEAGYYQVNAMILSESVAWAVGDIWLANVYKNDVRYNVGSYDRAQAATTTNKGASVYDIVYLAAGDYITIVIYHDRGLDTSIYAYLDTGGVYTYLSVHRLS